MLKMVIKFVNGHTHTLTDTSDGHKDLIIGTDRIIQRNVRNGDGEHVDEFVIPMNNVLYYTITEVKAN